MTLNASLAVLMPLTSLYETALSPLAASLICTLKLALEHVNTRNASIVPELANLRPGFSMNYTLLDTRLSAPVAVDLLVNYLFESRELADGVPRAVLGPLLSELATSTALLAGAEQVPMMSYRASAPELVQLRLSNSNPMTLTLILTLTLTLTVPYPNPNPNPSPKSNPNSTLFLTLTLTLTITLTLTLHAAVVSKLQILHAHLSVRHHGRPTASAALV